jgi:hypothetical protein
MKYFCAFYGKLIALENLVIYKWLNIQQSIPVNPGLGASRKSPTFPPCSRMEILNPFIDTSDGNA